MLKSVLKSWRGEIESSSNELSSLYQPDVSSLLYQLDVSSDVELLLDDFPPLLTPGSLNDICLLGLS
jgi:hypothetical protein